MQVNSANLVVENVNFINEELWKAFNIFFLLCITTKGLVEYFDRSLPEDLKSASLRFFEELKNTKIGSSPDVEKRADAYFENFTPIWNLSGKRNKALMYEVFDMVRQWEKDNDFLLHKGTLFYFWATTDIIHGDYDEGMILMHKALEEDRRKDWTIRSPNTPAHDFVSMNEKSGAYLEEITLDLVDFVTRRLTNYNKGGGTLQYDELRSKFLDSSDIQLEDCKFYFCYTILKWRRLRKIHKQKNIADDQMAPLIFTGLLSDLLLVIDELYKIALKPIYSNSAYTKRNINFSDHLFISAKTHSWTKNSDFKHYQSEKGINLNTELKKDFKKIITNLLSGKLNGKSLNSRESDFWLCYGLRNFSAHTIKSQKLLWDNFTEILQSVMNILFLGVEKIK